MEIHLTFKEHMSAVLKVLAIISIVVAIVVATSCSSKSQKMIIDSELPTHTVDIVKPNYISDR